LVKISLFIKKTTKQII